MLKHTLVITFSLFFTASVMAVDPLNNFKNMRVDIEEESSEQESSEQESNKQVDFKTFLTSKDYKPNRPYYISNLDDKKGESQAFTQFAFSPVGDSKNFSVNLYQGNWYVWGGFKLPFYLAYADTTTENEEEALATSLIDKSDGLSLNLPFMWAMKSGNIDSQHSKAVPSLIRGGFNFRGIVKELEGNDKYTFGTNASFVLAYSSFIELFSVNDQDNKGSQNGYLTLEANYTIHKYKDEDIRDALTGLELIETATYDSSFKSWGVKADAQFGDLFNISYVYEKVKQPILGYEKISRLTLTKSF